MKREATCFGNEPANHLEIQRPLELLEVVRYLDITTLLTS